jgi:hypothetical protein
MRFQIVVRLGGSDLPSFAYDQCRMDLMKSCLAQLSAIKGRDVSEEPTAQRFCQVDLPLCEKPLVMRSTDTTASPSVKTPPPKTDAGGYVLGGESRFYLRADPLDNPFPGLTQSVTPGQSLGASFGYTQNEFVQSLVQTKAGPITSISDASSLTFTGMATYLVAERQSINSDRTLEWVPSLWIYGNGNWDNPTKTFGDTSALKAGPKAEFLLHPVDRLNVYQFFDIAPFYQTDFYGKAEAEGLTASWMPVNQEWFLGASPNNFKPSFADGFLELRAESTAVDVRNPGQTLLTPQTYEWLGGASRAYVFFFPSNGDLQLPTSLKPFLEDKLSFVGTAQSYWDANSKTTASLYSLALQYKLSCDTKNPCSFGAPSVTVQYDNGIDKDTLQKKRLLSTKFTYAF